MFKSIASNPYACACVPNPLLNERVENLSSGKPKAPTASFIAFLTSFHFTTLRVTLGPRRVTNSSSSITSLCLNQSIKSSRSPLSSSVFLPSVFGACKFPHLDLEVFEVMYTRSAYLIKLLLTSPLRKYWLICVPPIILYSVPSDGFVTR